MDDQAFINKLSQAVSDGREMECLYSMFSYNSMVQLNETPIINFRNYRYKIVEIFVMTYKQEKGVLDVEIATPDILVILGTFSEHKLLDKLLGLNEHIARGGHSWNKLLLLAKGEVRLLVNTAFAVMHLFAGDMVALGDNEIVYCYILAAAVVGSIDKASRARLNRDIMKRGLKRTQYSISERPQSPFSLAPKVPKDSRQAEAAYVAVYQDEISNCSSDAMEDHKVQASQVDIFMASARRLSIRKACLKSLAEAGKDLPQVGRLLHLGRTEDIEPKQVSYYVGEDICAMPASDLGPHRYRKDSKSVQRKNSTRW